MAGEPTERSEAGIVTAALALLGRGAAVAADLHEQPEGRAIAQRLAQVRDAILRRYPWNFATRHGNIAGQSLVDDPLGFTSRARLPSDGADDGLYCLTVRRVIGRGNDTWVLRGRWLYCRAPLPVAIVYTGRVTDPGEFDPVFSEILAHELALANIHLADDATRGQRPGIERHLRELWRSGRRIDAIERSPGDFGSGDTGTWNGVRGRRY